MRSSSHLRAFVLLLAVTAGCSLDDEASRHRCLTDDDCAQGRFCVQLQCEAFRPPPGDGAAGDAAASDGPVAPPDAASPDVPASDPGDTGADQQPTDAEPSAVCGNSRREAREDCDDGNAFDDDLCDRYCRWTHPP